MIDMIGYLHVCVRVRACACACVSINIVECPTITIHICHKCFMDTYQGVYIHPEREILKRNKVINIIGDMM